MNSFRQKVKHRVNKKTKLMDRMALVFLLLGPLLDIFTSSTIKSTIATPGVIVRSIFILFAIFYLIFIDKFRRKLNITLLSLLFIIMIAVFVINFNLISSVNSQFLGYVFKFIFLCTGIIFFSSWASRQTSFDAHVFRVPFCIIIVSFGLAIATNTALPTYQWGDGYSGWFSSANEFGTLLCCIFPFSLYNAFESKKDKHILAKISDLIIVICLSLIMLTVGTKAPFIGFLSLSSIYFIYRLITIKNNRFPLSILIIPALLLFTVISWNHLPTITNTNLRLKKIKSVKTSININANAIASSSAINEKNSAYAKSNYDLSSKATSSINLVSHHTDTTTEIIFNGRDDFEKQSQEARAQDASINHIAVFLFGKFYTNNSKFLLIERDFHDIYMLFGLSGLIFVIILIMPAVLLSIIRLFSSINRKQNHFNFIVLLSVSITLGIALISGHTLLSPSVSSFFMLSLALLMFNNPALTKRTVVFIASTGGHLTQLTMLSPIYERYNSYLITEKTPIKLKSSVPVKYVLHCSRKQPISYLFKSIFNLIRSFFLFAIINPDVIVTTGTHTAIPMCLYGYLFRRKTIYIESFAKNSSPTATGRLLYHFVDVFIVQWKSMQKVYSKAKYFGGIY